MAKSAQIKRANQEIEYTPEQVMELKRCAKDPVYCISNYFKIEHPLHGLVLFELRDYQIEMINLMENNQWVALLMGRQLGKCVLYSTCINIYVKPKNKIKKIILKIFYRNIYDEIYKK